MQKGSQVRPDEYPPKILTCNLNFKTFRVLKLLETLRLYADFLRDYTAALASSIQDISQTGCCPIHIRMVPGGDPATQKDLLICRKLYLICLGSWSKMLRHHFVPYMVPVTLEV